MKESCQEERSTELGARQDEDSALLQMFSGVQVSIFCRTCRIMCNDIVGTSTERHHEILASDSWRIVI